MQESTECWLCDSNKILHRNEEGGVNHGWKIKNPVNNTVLDVEPGDLPGGAWQAAGGLEQGRRWIQGMRCKVGRQETPGVAGKFSLGAQKEAGQRLTEFCQENAPVIANTLFQQHKRRLYTWTSPDGQYWPDWLYSLQPKMEKIGRASCRERV